MDIQMLQERVAQDETFQYLFFWGHTQKNGRIGAFCLSQWYEADFEVDGQVYPTAEHYMMAGKARLFKDNEALQEILRASHPADAKKWGRKVKGFTNELWNQHRVEIVIQANVAKFGQNPPLREFLLQTGNRILVEASPRDQIWGIGLGKDNPKAMNPFQWRGSNLLGFALMKVRERLRQEEET